MEREKAREAPKMDLEQRQDWTGEVRKGATLVKRTYIRGGGSAARMGKMTASYRKRRHMKTEVDRQRGRPQVAWSKIERREEH